MAKVTEEKPEKTVKIQLVREMEILNMGRLSSVTQTQGFKITIDEVKRVVTLRPTDERIRREVLIPFEMCLITRDI